MNVGQVCVKISGRDAGKKAVVVEVIDANYVLIDGETRRRKCNLIHLMPLKEVVDISSGAAHDAVKSALDKLGVKARETKAKEKTKAPARKRKAPVKKVVKTVKKTVKKPAKATGSAPEQKQA